MTLPAGLPVPVDDGAADHLPGAVMPPIELAATDGSVVRLDAPLDGRTVVFAYPRTGEPDRDPPGGLAAWDAIPGARGCTPQSCAFRDTQADLAAHGASLIGISAQTPQEQAEFAEREHIPYPLLSDDGLALADAMGLPTFETSGLRLYKRLTFIAEQGRIVKVFYPVFPPDRNAGDVLAWLEGLQSD